MTTMNELGKDFGAFYPTGHTVVGFSNFQNAKSVHADLRTLGPVFDKILFVTPQEMIDFATTNIAQAGVIATMGTSLTTLQNFLDAARSGAHFLVIPTPDDEAADTITQTLSHVSHLLAQRYRTLVIEDIV